MRVHYISHAPFEGLGAINQWVKDHDHVVSGTRSYAGEPMPDPSSFDLLIVMGGPQSATEYEKYDFLQDEVELIRASIKANKYILGTCLGGQLIGIALGAPSTRSPHKEMGCFPIELTEEGKSDRIFQHFPPQFPGIHWHHDMIGIPKGAAVLAKSEGCPVQAVRFSEKVYGLQCHLEFTEKRMRTLIEKCPRDLAPSQYTQTPEQMLSCHFSEVNQYIIRFLDLLVQFA